MFKDRVETPDDVRHLLAEAVAERHRLEQREAALSNYPPEVAGWIVESVSGLDRMWGRAREPLPAAWWEGVALLKENVRQFAVRRLLAYYSERIAAQVIGRDLGTAAAAWAATARFGDVIAWAGRVVADWVSDSCDVSGAQPALEGALERMHEKVFGVPGGALWDIYQSLLQYEAKQEDPEYPDGPAECMALLLQVREFGRRRAESVFAPSVVEEYWKKSGPRGIFAAAFCPWSVLRAEVDRVVLPAVLARVGNR